jgi:exonuclease III
MDMMSATPSSYPYKRTKPYSTFASTKRCEEHPNSRRKEMGVESKLLDQYAWRPSRLKENGSKWAFVKVKSPQSPKKSQSNLNSTEMYTSKGDCITIKEPGSIRFFFQNINGVRPKTMDKWKKSIDTIKQLKCDIVALCEMRINWKLPRFQKKYQQALTRSFPNSSMVVTTTSQYFKRASIPGGSSMLVLGKYTSNIRNTIHDPLELGRWCGSTLRINSKQLLHVVSAYRVCQSQIKHHYSMSTYSQQYFMLLQQGINQPDPRKQFITDMTNLLTFLTENKDNYVILGIDANEAVTGNNSEICEMITKCNLVDIYARKHQDATEFATHIKGSKRIDFIFCTENIVPFIDRVGYVPFHRALDTDHRACFCDISPSILSPVSKRIT